MTESDHMIHVVGCYSLCNMAAKKELCKALVHFLVLGRLKQCIDQFVFHTREVRKGQVCVCVGVGGVTREVRNGQMCVCVYVCVCVCVCF